MASFNRVILAGNLTRDPEVRHTPSGTAVAELGLAINRKWFDKQANEWKEDVTFVDVVVWGKTAENVGEYLAKGSGVLIEGRLQLDQWQDRDSGQNRQKLKVRAEVVTFLDQPAGGGGQQRQQQPQGQGQGRQQGNQGNRQQGRGRQQGGQRRQQQPPQDYAQDYGPGEDVPF